MKNLKGEKLTFANSNLSDLSDGHLKTLYVFAHILNRLKLLEGQVFAYFSTANRPEVGPIQSEAAIYGAIDTLLYLAGELKEAREAIKKCYHDTKLSATVNSKLDCEAKEALKRIPEFCSKNQDIFELRNRFSFHHSPDEVLATAKNLKDDDQHNTYLLGGDMNFFGFAADLRILTIAKALGLDDPNTVVDHLVDVVITNGYADVSRALTAILCQILSEVEMGVTEITVPCVPSTNESRMNFFFHIDSNIATDASDPKQQENVSSV